MPIYWLWPVASFFFAFPVSCSEFLQWFDTVGWASERASSLQNWVMRCWCVYLSGVRCRLFAYGPADAASIPKPHHLLPHLNADWFYRLTQVVLEKRPLNECSSSYTYFCLMTVYLLFGNWMCLYISVQCGCLSFPYDDTIVWSWCSGINLLSVLMSLFDLGMLIVFFSTSLKHAVTSLCVNSALKTQVSQTTSDNTSIFIPVSLATFFICCDWLQSISGWPITTCLCPVERTTTTMPMFSWSWTLLRGPRCRPCGRAGVMLRRTQNCRNYCTRMALFLLVSSGLLSGVTVNLI